MRISKARVKRARGKNKKTNVASAATSAGYVYTALRGEDYIRILTIQPASNLDDDLVCELENSPTSSAEYAALSYSWAMEDGDASFCRSITLGGKAKLVTRNLFEGMRRIRSKDRQLRIWIDALCIDQDNTLERNSQVAQMAKVYQRATRVLVWLGEGQNEGEDEDMEAIFARLSQHTCRDHLDRPHRSCVLFSALGTDNEECGCINPRYLWQEQLDDFIRESLVAVPAHHRRCVSAIWSFSARRYWTRRWVTQELFHARAQTWYWGPCVRNVLENMQNWWTSLLETRYWIRQILDECGKADQMDDVNQRLGKQWIPEDVGPRGFPVAMHSFGRGVTLLEALCEAKGQECSDPRDKVFALVSMCEPAIVPDYRLSPAQVWSRAAHALLNSGGVDAWLNTLYNRQRATLSRPHPDCPSWVIDPDEIISYGASQPLSTTMSDNGTLTCEVCCFGTFAKTSSEAISFEISWARRFNDCDDWRWDPDLASSYLKEIIWVNRLRMKSEHPDRYAFHRYDEAHRILESDQDETSIRPGDALCTLTREFDGDHLTRLFVLRQCEGLTSTFKIVSAFDSNMYLATITEPHIYFDFFEFEPSDIDHDAGSERDHSSLPTGGLDGDVALVHPTIRGSANQTQLLNRRGYPVEDRVVMHNSVFFTIKTTVNII